MGPAGQNRGIPVNNQLQDRGHGRGKALVLPVLLFLVSGAAGTQAQPPSEAEDQQDFRLSVDVDLVLLQATVRDKAGHSMTDLKQQDFTVYEDGHPQAIHLFRHEDTPLTIGLVVDHSGSMIAKLGEVTVAARALVRASDPQDELFVVNFNEKVTLGLSGPLRFSNDPNELGAAIGQASAVGETALYDAIAAGLEGLQKGTRDKKVLVVISDGGDNRSRCRMADVLRMAGLSSAAIYTIGLTDENDPDWNPKVLQRLAKETGGEAFFPKEVSETIGICRRIATDVQEQYTLGYIPPKAEAGVYHKVRVTAHSAEHGKLMVRTRAGYITGREPKAGSGTR